MSAAGAKKVVVDPLIAKLNNMTQKEALEKLSKEEIAEVVAEGQRVIAKEDGGKIHQETVIEETVGETKPLEVTVGGEKIPSEAPATPKETPELSTTDTRGQGQQYHGSSQKIDEFLTDENYLSEGNIYGEGFYTTEAMDVAEGYTKKGSGKEPSLYRVDEKSPVNFLDIDTFKFKDLKLPRLSDEFQEIINEFGDNATVRDVFDELRMATDDYGNKLTTDEIIEGAFFPINDKIKEMGYGGIEHVGGKTFNKAPHKVKIYLNPKEQIELKPVTKPEAPEASATTATPKETPETTPAPKTRQELTLEEVDSFEVKTPKPEEAETGKPWSGTVVKGVRDKAERTDAGDYGKGDYWSGDTSRAKAYAKPVVGEEGTVGKVIADDVSLENPLVFKTTDEARTYRQEVIGDKADPFNPQDEAAAQLIDADLRAKGHDGVVVYDSAGNYTATPEKPFEVVALKGQTKKLEATPAPKTPEVAPEATPRQQGINSLKEQLSEMDSTTMSQEMPSIERDAKKIYTDLYDEISVNVRKLEKENNPEAIASLLSQIKELRELNINVKDVVETTAGRSLQAARRDASKYNWADQYSMRSQQEDAALALLEETL